MVAMGTRRPRKGLRLCKRYALQRRGNTPGLRQILRATECDKLSETMLTFYKRLEIARSIFTVLDIIARHSR